MLSKKLQNAINKQIRLELSSGYSYLSMCAYFESENLPGFAHWMRLQYQEEVAHGLKLFDYVNSRGGKVLLESLDQPPSGFKSPLDVFQKVLAHEQNVSTEINKLYAMADAEKDYPTVVELQWFVREQVEEEKSVQNVLEHLKLIGDNGVSLLMLDRQLGARTAR